MVAAGKLANQLLEAVVGASGIHSAGMRLGLVLLALPNLEKLEVAPALAAHIPKQFMHIAIVRVNVGVWRGVHQAACRQVASAVYEFLSAQLHHFNQLRKTKTVFHAMIGSRAGRIAPRIGALGGHGGDAESRGEAHKKNGKNGARPKKEDWNGVTN